MSAATTSTGPVRALERVGDPDGRDARGASGSSHLRNARWQAPAGRCCRLAHHRHRIACRRQRSQRVGDQRSAGEGRRRLGRRAEPAAAARRRARLRSRRQARDPDTGRVRGRARSSPRSAPGRRRVSARVPAPALPLTRMASSRIRGPLTPSAAERSSAPQSRGAGSPRAARREQLAADLVVVPPRAWRARARATVAATSFGAPPMGLGAESEPLRTPRQKGEEPPVRTGPASRLRG